MCAEAVPLCSGADCTEEGLGSKPEAVEGIKDITAEDSFKLKGDMETIGCGSMGPGGAHGPQVEAAVPNAA